MNNYANPGILPGNLYAQTLIHYSLPPTYSHFYTWMVLILPLAIIEYTVIELYVTGEHWCIIHYTNNNTIQQDNRTRQQNKWSRQRGTIDNNRTWEDTILFIWTGTSFVVCTMHGPDNVSRRISHYPRFWWWGGLQGSCMLLKMDREIQTRVDEDLSGNQNFKGNTLGKKATIHQATSMLAIFTNVLFPGHNHLLTTGAENPTLWLSLEHQTFLEVASMVVTWWIVAFMYSDKWCTAISLAEEFQDDFFSFKGILQCIYYTFTNKIYQKLSRYAYTQIILMSCICVQPPCERRHAKHVQDL